MKKTANKNKVKLTKSRRNRPLTYQLQNICHSDLIKPINTSLIVSAVNILQTNIIYCYVRGVLECVVEGY